MKCGWEECQWTRNTDLPIYNARAGHSDGADASQGREKALAQLWRLDLLKKVSRASDCFDLA